MIGIQNQNQDNPMFGNDFFEGLTSARPLRGVPIDAVSGKRLNGRRSGPEESMYVNWFLEDVAKSLPYGRGLETGFQLALSPANPTVEGWVLNAFPAHTYGHTTLSEAFRQFLIQATYDIVRGNLYIEIEYFHKYDVEDGKPVAFRLHILPRESVSKRFGKYRQAHEVDSEVLDGTVQRFKEPLDPKNLVVGFLPPPWAKRASRTISLLSEVSSQMSVATEFLTGDHGHHSGFDFKVHRELINDLVLTRTRTIGWAGRNTFIDGMLDPEKAWRAIQFAKFQIVVRDAVLTGLQEAIGRAGRAIGFKARVELQGVLDSANLEEFEVELQSGGRRILELIHPELSSIRRAEP